MVLPHTDDYDEAVASNHLEESEITPETGSVSEDEGGSWLGAISTDFRNIATCFSDTLPSVLGGVGNLVQKTALSVASEIAQLERNQELDEIPWMEGSSDLAARIPGSLPLPWQVQDETSENEEPVFIADEELMARVLALSLDESTFLEPFSSDVGQKEKPDFVLHDDLVSVIQTLLDTDGNLAEIHVRLTGRNDVHETVFWKNYFFHCNEIKNDFLEKRRTKKHAANPNHDHEEIRFENSVENTTTLEREGEGGLDSSSLIPASLADDSSYVIPSPPNSLNTFATTKSLEDLVLVDCVDKANKK